jgi:MFS family permease
VTATTASPAPTLRDRAHLPFAVGAVALVTLGAFENRAVSTILPTGTTDLHGLWLFGAASAAPLVSFVVATTVAGGWSDRRGPTPVLYAGMAVFVAGELMLGLAPSMEVFVLGRLLGGMAEGLLDVGLTVLVARALPPELRPRVFATFAAAWVLPSLLGPSIAGVVAEQVHWRAVFLLGVALLVPVAALLRPAMTNPSARATATDTSTTRGARSAGWALLASTGLAALTAGASLVTRDGWWPAAGSTLLIAGLVMLAPALRAILPPGTAKAMPGIPVLTLLRGLLGAAFGTTGGLLPLMLTEVHGFGPAGAGTSLTVTGLVWALGSQVQGWSVVQRRTDVGLRLRVGFALLTVGLVGPVLLSAGLVPVWLGLAGWAVAGVGIGITSPTISNHVLTLSSTADQGRNSAASFLAPSVTQAVAYAATGAAIAWAAPHPGGGLFAALMVGPVVLAALALALSGRGRQSA